MRRYIYLIFILIFSYSCQTQKRTGPEADSLLESHSPTTFLMRFANDSVTSGLLQDSTIYGSGASVAIKRIEGFDALEVRTDQEFSDAFIDLEKLFDHTIDFSEAKYAILKILVPEGSWISALKFNLKDAEGNFGGFNEIANNFNGNYGSWQTIAVDMREVVPQFKSWYGAGNPLPKVRFLSLNPYSAHQADSSSIFVHSIELAEELPKNQNIMEALAPRPSITPNIPHTITFDDEELLRKQTAIRAFESTYQALAENVAGNESMAIRLKGKESNTHLAFLPILDKLTGGPVDFTKVERLHFSYYLTEDSADFDGSILYLANEGWENVLIHENLYSDFKKGTWHDVSINLSDLNLDILEGHEKVLPNVYEIRFGLNYRPEEKNIEMWLDNFGWE